MLDGSGTSCFVGAVIPRGCYEINREMCNKLRFVSQVREPGFCA